jgi:hypothetical protein
MNLQGHCTHLCKTRYKLTKIMPLEKRKQYPHTNHRRPLGLKSDGDPLYEHLKMGSLRSPSLCQKKKKKRKSHKTFMFLPVHCGHGQRRNNSIRSFIEKLRQQNGMYHADAML